MGRRGYFDNNATTQLDARVREAMLSWMGSNFGNPSSTHRFGRAAREAVEEARDRVAALIGARPAEVVFMASGTEAINTVVTSSCGMNGASPHVVVSSFEHPAVLESALRLERRGGSVTRIAPEASGTVSEAAFREALTRHSRLACLMLANNELGTVQPVRRVADACRDSNVPLFCDAVQAVGKIPVELDELRADYLLLAGHKFHGPLGAAALWVSPTRELTPLLVGGGQERRRRSGTLDVPAIVGLGVACELARLELEQRARHLLSLRDCFERGLASIAGAIVHCKDSERLPNTSHVAFPGVDATSLLIRLDLRGFAVSTGSACASGAAEMSPALAAIGLDPAEARASLRISFGMTNEQDEVDELVETLASEVAALRGS